MACAHSNLVFYAQSTITVTSGQLCTQYVYMCLGVLCPVNQCGYVWAIVHTERKKREKKIMLAVLDKLLEWMLSLVSVLFCQNSKDFIMTASLWLLCWLLLWFNYTMACCLTVRTCISLFKILFSVMEHDELVTVGFWGFFWFCFRSVMCLCKRSYTHRPTRKLMYKNTTMRAAARVQ